MRSRSRPDTRRKKRGRSRSRSRSDTRQKKRSRSRSDTRRKKRGRSRSDTIRKKRRQLTSNSEVVVNNIPTQEVMVYLSSGCGVCIRFEADGGLSELEKHFIVKSFKDTSDVSVVPTFKSKGKTIEGYSTIDDVVKQLKSL